MAGFQDIIGQEQICEHLQTALKLQKVSHAYIINGERNSGKKFIARIFAMALQCTGEGEKPCQVCRSCRQALSENHPDIIRITHEKPNSIGVEDIRTQVNNDMGIKPYQGPYKVYLIEEAEKNDGSGAERAVKDAGGAAGIRRDYSDDVESRSTASNDPEPVRAIEYASGT